MRGDEFPSDLLFLALEDQGFFGTDENGWVRGLQTPSYDGCQQTSPTAHYESHSASSSKPASPEGGDLSSGSSSPRTLGKSGRPVNPVPRHKRHSHISAEHRRRNKIQRGFAELQSLVPAVNDNPSSRDSKSAKLFKTAEYCRQLKAECKNQEDEANALRRELEALGTHIHQFQSQLPAAGLNKVQKPTCHMDNMLDEYLSRRTCQDWKFWIFSLLVRPLYTTYNAMVSTNSMGEFIGSVLSWVESHCSLVSLRPAVLTMLRQVSTQTSIMTDPSRVPEEALQRVLESQTAVTVPSADKVLPRTPEFPNGMPHISGVSDVALQTSFQFLNRMPNTSQVQEDTILKTFDFQHNMPNS